MATANPTFTGTGRRRRPESMAAMVLTPAVRSRMEAQISAFLDGANFLLDMLDAADAQHADKEPDVDGEAEPDEASAQPVTLSPDRARAVTHRPSARQMCAAYRRNGDPIPANLRSLALQLRSTLNVGLLSGSLVCSSPE